MILLGTKQRSIRPKVFIFPLKRGRSSAEQACGEELGAGEAGVKKNKSLCGEAGEDRGE